MPSPFPGMNPFLENPNVWEDFHRSLLLHVRDALVPQTGKKYRVRIEERLYLRELSADERFFGRSDVHVTLGGPRAAATASPASASAATLAYPLVLPGVDETRERYLEVVDRQSERVVTVLELLSPTNKRGPSDADAAAYLKKRNRLMRSGVHLVEIDLLRAGTRPQPPEAPPSDYQMLVARTRAPATVEIWSVGLREALPRLPIPLADPDPDVVLDLKEVLERTCDLAGYANEIYGWNPVPPLLPKDAAWAEELLREAGLRNPATA